MSLIRHIFILLGTATVSLLWAQGYPAKALRIAVPLPAGGAADILARSISQKLAEPWKQQVIVDNRHGAGATIGAEIAAKLPPDGHTRFGISTLHCSNPRLYSTLAYDPQRNFLPVINVAATSRVLTAHASLPVNNG
jgi:tripartite-type tricarboxylate transporter receptor subunit TctC